MQVNAVSDVAESIRIHGYDITLTLPAAAPGEVTFTADQVGVFEVHTKENAKLIAGRVLTIARRINAVSWLAACCHASARRPSPGAAFVLVADGTAFAHSSLIS